MRERAAWLALLILVVTTACSGPGCFYGEATNLPEWRAVKGENGVEYRLVERGAYKLYYDLAGRLDRIEFDSNNDGRADYVARHEGAPKARLLEIDTDHDGRMDRWEFYDEAGELVKIGYSTGGDQPDHWAHLGPDGLPTKMEYDSDGDGRVDRAELFEAARLVRVELDTDRDGRIDRWMDWRSGILDFEDIDTDGDGRPDRRLRYNAAGEVEALEPLPDE